ncbi:MAG TPA: hypothetical protein VHH12_03430 [Mycobacterium sp.]|nr:hypothetical protein [Mycobacterium sp.]
MLLGLLVAALLALGLAFRWLRYNDDGDGVPWVWAIAFAIAAPLCMLAAWRAGRRRRTRTAGRATNVEGLGRQFDLVAAEGTLQFQDDGWTRARSLLLELVPAKRVTLIGDPPTRIRVEPQAISQVESAVLARLEELAGVPLQVETR